MLFRSMVKETILIIARKIILKKFLNLPLWYYETDHTLKKFSIFFLFAKNFAFLTILVITALLMNSHLTFFLKFNYLYTFYTVIYIITCPCTVKMFQLGNLLVHFERKVFAFGNLFCGRNCLNEKL